MRLNDWGTAAELTAADPVVPVGEIYVERDTGKAKRGTNGTQTWTELDYWNPEDNDGVSEATAISTAVADSAATLVERVSTTTTALEDVADAINTVDKYAGKMVWNATTGIPDWADGPLDEDTWSGADGAVDHTPVGP